MGRYSIFLQLITAQNNNSSLQLQIPSYECVIDALCHWQITIGALSQLMKKMPAFRKQVTQVIEMPHMPWKSAITWHLGPIHSTGCLKYCRNPTVTQLPVYVSHLFQKTVHVSLAEDLMSHYQKYVEKLCKAEQVESMVIAWGKGRPLLGRVCMIMPLVCGLCLGSGRRCRCWRTEGQGPHEDVTSCAVKPVWHNWQDPGRPSLHLQPQRWMFLFSCHVEIRKHLICFPAGCVKLNICVFVYHGQVRQRRTWINWSKMWKSSMRPGISLTGNIWEFPLSPQWVRGCFFLLWHCIFSNLLLLMTYLVVIAVL